jgi:hypothetical protein
VPLHGRDVADTVAAVRTLPIRTGAISTRPPTLDDVYLRLTGGRLADAA